MYGVKETCVLYLDGKEFHQNFDYDGLKTMKQRLMDAGIAEERIKLIVRTPNL